MLNRHFLASLADEEEGGVEGARVGEVEEADNEGVGLGVVEGETEEDATLNGDEEIKRCNRGSVLSFTRFAITQKQFLKLILHALFCSLSSYCTIIFGEKPDICTKLSWINSICVGN